MYTKCTDYGIGAFEWCVLVRVSFVYQCSQQQYVLWYKAMSLVVLFVVLLQYHSTWLYLTLFALAKFCDSPGVCVSIAV